ncbi:hypothetical protein J7F01_03345 [Streptomyces sp. ISL-22]|uniref:hypothetical protein n=1 Tax=unclassified Streptomyces TaxID=2593676 RepID=UPI001BEC3D5D|nr:MULTISPECIES: hypothetical protein [unclassified Streptomyces]MBT2419158.1 hypothetical protein [Streptomyces sp. ISL-24]MBT2431253.1 hypothetical protein [Streptomyces sp. ISL-22]
MRTGRAFDIRGGFRRVLLALFALAASAALFATATTPARAATGTATATATQAAYLADRLRTNPVHVTDQLPREVPQSTTPAFAEVAERTGVPTYVLVLPGPSATEPGLLSAVHKRLGRDGLYVLIDESHVVDAAAHGVDVPADDAWTVALYEVPYDAGPLRRFETFVEVIAQGDAKAAARAEAARAKYDDGEEPAALYIGPSDRADQSTLTGVLLTGVPLLILVLVPYVRRWWHRLPRAAGTTGAAWRKEVRASRALRWMVPALAVASAAAIAVTASVVFDQTRSSWSPPPRAIDLNARLDRVAEGLAQDAVYQDPESPRVLSAGQLDRLHDRIGQFTRSEGGGPVFVSLVPQLTEDESEGDEEAFAAAVHDKLGEDGVYVVADPVYGSIDVFNHGLRLDSMDLLLDLPESIAEGDEEADDHRLGERLDALMTVLDKAPRTDEPDSAGDPYPVTDPVTEDDLPPLFGGDFGSGLVVGVLAAGLFFGLVAGVLGIVRRVLGGRAQTAGKG